MSWQVTKQGARTHEVFSEHVQQVKEIAVISGNGNRDKHRHVFMILDSIELEKKGHALIQLVTSHQLRGTWCGANKGSK